MKSLSPANFFKCFIVTLISSCLFLICWSQDSTRTTTHTTTTEHHEWYTIPWVWVVGGIAVILLFIALINSGRRSSSRTTTVTDTATGTKTVTTDND